MDVKHGNETEQICFTLEVPSYDDDLLKAFFFELFADDFELSDTRTVFQNHFFLFFFAILQCAQSSLNQWDSTKCPLFDWLNDCACVAACSIRMKDNHSISGLEIFVFFSTFVACRSTFEGYAAAMMAAVTTTRKTKQKNVDYRMKINDPREYSRFFFLCVRKNEENRSEKKKRSKPWPGFVPPISSFSSSLFIFIFGIEASACVKVNKLLTIASVWGWFLEEWSHQTGTKNESRRPREK